LAGASAGPRLLSVHLGTSRRFGPAGEPSAILKRAVSGTRAVGVLGLLGDAQADRRHHGGPEQAVHQYPREHYPRWRQELPAAAAAFTPAAFGENLSSLGMTETGVCIGDIYRLGTALLQVSQPRHPCWKLAHRVGVADLPQRVITTGRSGWYYRVLEPGWLAAGAALVLVERPQPDWPLARIQAQVYAEPDEPGALAELATLGCLAESWRARAARRLAGLGTPGPAE
jgi:MOSC domain-containing protein YiiM